MQVKLKVLVGKSTGKEIEIPTKHFMIGRGDDCHMRPKSDAISRNHCAILTQGEDVIVRDMNSRNGTFVNGERLKGDLEVNPGDHIQIGKLEFELVIIGRKEKVSQTIKPKEDGNAESLEFDISEWLDEDDKTQAAEPETRQFQLDETDRLALAQASEEAEQAKDGTPEKKEPGKLPKQDDSAGSSREAAADMLKKFFNSR